MRYASVKDIKQLIQTPEYSKAISIFLPLHRISLPHNLRADRIRMKNAIRDVVATLEQEKIPSHEIREYVEKLHKLHADMDFWKNRDNGIAIYAQRGQMTYFDLPIEINMSVHVGENFIISPLLTTTKGKYSYYLLELNSVQPRIFISSQTEINEVLENVMPGSLEQALRIDEYQQTLQHGTSRGAARDAHHHGHGAEKDNKINDLMRYYRLVDSKLHKHLLRQSSLPLIIAADSRTADMFKNISSYKFINDEIMEGNYQHANKDELHRKSWEVMCKRIESEEALFKKLFNKAKNRDDRQALVNGTHIRQAARQGRIATLAISIIHQTYDSVVSRMERRFKIELPTNKRQLRNIENSAREVIMTGGDITTLLYQNGNDEQNNSYIQAITR